MINIKNLSFSYHNLPVFNDLSFNSGDFRVLAILGLNGEGKTTLIKLILGLIKPDKGSIVIDGQNISLLKDGQRASLLSYVPQENDSGLNMSVVDFICLGTIIKQSILHGPSEADRQKAKDILEQLSCGELLNRQLNELSSGQRRLVYLARAVYQNSRIIVMDEPVSSLDFKKQHEFLSWLAQYCQKEKRQVIMSVHDPALAYQYADSFIFLKDHKLAASVSKEDPDFKTVFTSAVSNLYENSVEAVFVNEKLFLTYHK